MIDLYYWPTPNGWKISIFLEETATPYRVVPVDIRSGEQFTPEFLAISPNNRMPAIVDTDGPGGKPISVFESAAILMYLGDKIGRFYPKETRARTAVNEWLMWQMGGVGPMFGQANHFRRYAPEPLPYAIDRYTKEAKRLARILDKRLADHEFVAGEYSIADMAIFPWFHAVEKLLELQGECPNVKRWCEQLEARPAVRAGLDVMKDDRGRVAELTPEIRSVLFGEKQFEKR
jgi:GSH-dependent disulfide-bond oxidoreductase